MNSDCVEYMKKKHPLPKNVYLLPEPVQQKRDLLANQNDPEPKTLSVCILGYCNLAYEIITSLREDALLSVHLVTKSIIES